MTGTLHIGIDTGGTFTDLVVFDAETGSVRALKTSSTPREPGDAFANALTAGSIEGHSIEALTHGTTVGTNALIERKGCRVGFLTTSGFEDTPFIQRINRQVLYDLTWSKPRPLVASRRVCLGVDERIDHDGVVVRELDESSVRDACRCMRNEGVDAIAISLLFSYVATDHEQRVRRIVEEELPGIPVSVSHEVAPIWREYERASTTIADAYLKPLLRRYVESTDRALRGRGMIGPWTIMKSNGGAMSAERTPDAAVQTVMSGPAGGMIASRHYARALGEPDVITIDIGGTSADVGLIIDGEYSHTTEYEIEWGLPAAVPVVDIRSIGAGGGSIAWVDSGGFLRVGPESAGADPGPICYGRGGTLTTVTDANLVLGRLAPEYFLGGAMELDVDAPGAPMDGLAERLGMSKVELASSIIEIANENMASAIRRVSLERGHDPRRFALLAFGGAGGLQAVAIARAVGIPRVIIPPNPGMLSAVGLLLADLRVDAVWTQGFRSTDLDHDAAVGAFARTEDRARSDLHSEGFAGEPEIERAISMRYLGQNYEHEVALAAGEVTPATVATAIDRFATLHTERYGYSISGEVVELVAFRVTAVGRRPEPHLVPSDDLDPTPTFVRDITFRGLGAVPTTVIRRDSLRFDTPLPGPLLILEEGSTTLVDPTSRVTRVQDGSLLIDLGDHDDD